MLKTMTPNVDGHGTTMRDLPGSETSIVGGPLLCMYHRIEPSPLVLGDWECGSVYMRVAHERPRPYVGDDCRAVLDGINAMNADPRTAAEVLLRGAHAEGQPLPGFYTVDTDRGRVDFHVYSHAGRKHLYGLLMRPRPMRV